MVNLPNKKISINYLSLIFLITGSVNSALAKELVVDNSLCAATDIYCDIQSAIDAATAGDTVTLAKGNYELWQESITIDKSITLAGDSSENTLLLGEGNAPASLIVVTSDAEEVVLKNLTIAGRIVSGSPTMGAGGLDFRGGDLVIDNVAFKDNRGGWGGALRITAVFGTVQIRDSKFTGNTGFAGGGIAVYDGSALDLIIEDSYFSGNNAVFSGGAMLMRDVATVELKEVEILNNSAGNTGGGVHIFTDTGTMDLTVTTSNIEGNSASKVGGLSTNGENISVTLNETRLQGNKSRNQLPTSDCGGVSFELLGDNSIDQQNQCQN